MMNFECPIKRTKEDDIALLKLLSITLHELTVPTANYETNIPIELDLHGYPHVAKETELILDNLIEPRMSETSINSKKLIQTITSKNR